MIDKKDFLYIFIMYEKQLSTLKKLIKETDVILNRAKDYNKNDNERLREQARDKYRNLPEEEKNKKREFGKIDTIIYLKKRNKN